MHYPSCASCGDKPKPKPTEARAKHMEWYSLNKKAYNPMNDSIITCFHCTEPSLDEMLDKRNVEELCEANQFQKLPLYLNVKGG